MTLYKYVIADRVDILKNGHIRFTQPAALNDPYEMRPYIEKLAPGDFWNEELIVEAMELPQSQTFLDIANNKELFEKLFEQEWYKLPRKRRRATPLIKYKASMWQVAQANPQEIKGIYIAGLYNALELIRSLAPHVIKELPEIINKTASVLSLTETPCESLMWSHYADTHSGFVIAFDERHSFFTTLRSEKDVVNGLHQITYSTQMPVIEALSAMFDDNSEALFATKLFFTKSAQWKDEKEWRMVRALTEADNVIENPEGNIYLFALPPECLTEIILGYKMPSDKRTEITDFLRSDDRYNHVVISKAVISEMSFDIQIEPV